MRIGFLIFKIVEIVVLMVVYLLILMVLLGFCVIIWSVDFLLFIKWMWMILNFMFLMIGVMILVIWWLIVVLVIRLVIGYLNIKKWVCGLLIFFGGVFGMILLVLLLRCVYVCYFKCVRYLGLLLMFGYLFVIYWLKIVYDIWYINVGICCLNKVYKCGYYDFVVVFYVVLNFDIKCVMDICI